VKVSLVLLLLLFAVSVLGLTPVNLSFPSSEATYTYYEEYFLLFNSSASFKDLDFIVMNSIDSLLFVGPNYTTTLITPIGINALTSDRDIRAELEGILDSSTVKVSSVNVMTTKNNHTPSYIWLKYLHNGEEKWILLSLFLVENGFAEYEECRVLSDLVTELLLEAQTRAEEQLIGQWRRLASTRVKGESTQEPRGNTFIYSPAGSSDVYSAPSFDEFLDIVNRNEDYHWSPISTLSFSRSLSEALNKVPGEKVAKDVFYYSETNLTVFIVPLHREYFLTGWAVNEDPSAVDDFSKILGSNYSMLAITFVNKGSNEYVFNTSWFKIGDGSLLKPKEDGGYGIAYFVGDKVVQEISLKPYETRTPMLIVPDFDKNPTVIIGAKNMTFPIVMYGTDSYVCEFIANEFNKWVDIKELSEDLKIRYRIH